MFLLPSFLAVVQPLGVAMTAPTFRTFRQLLVGWLLARRPTITGMLHALGLAGTTHHARFYYVFAAARWSADRLGLALFDALVRVFCPRGVVWLALDDTHIRKRGVDIFGAGMQHDPLLSTRTRHVSTWGLDWVVLCVVVHVPACPGRAFSLPVLARLYLNHKASARARRVHRSKPELAVDLLGVLCAHAPDRRFHALVDSSYGGQSVLAHLPPNCDLTSCLDLDARLHAPPPPRRSGRRGRPRVHGDRLPTPREMLTQPGRRVTLDLYGRHDRVRLVETTARTHAVPGRALRVVVVEPLVGGRPVRAFFSTVATAHGVQVLRWYADRWSIEETFFGSKHLLGAVVPQVWCRAAVERVAPVGFLLYSLVVLWFHQVGAPLWHPRATSWYASRRTPSFADMVTTLRRALVRHVLISATPANTGQTQKIPDAIVDLIARAA